MKRSTLKTSTARIVPASLFKIAQPVEKSAIVYVRYSSCATEATSIERQSALIGRWRKNGRIRTR
jgi:hypothetical protein